MSSRKIFNHESVILHDLTLEKEGYSPDQFGPSSAKFIWAVCRFCGEPSRIRKGFFNKSGSACHKQCRIEEQKRQKSPFNDPVVREKAKKTNLERYGHEYASSNKGVAAKISAIKKTPKYKAKVAQTNLERHGVVNVFESEEIKDKIKKVNLEKYGHPHPMQNAKKKLQGAAQYKQQFANNPLNKHSIVITLRDNKFWDELAKDGVTLESTCDLFGLNYKDTTTMISRPEFRQKYYDTYSFPKYQSQNEIKSYLSVLGLQVEFNVRNIISPLELDIYIPDFKFAIEFNGSYWHSEAHLSSKEARNKHRRKLDECRKHHIRLFHIFEHQWNERKIQILNFVKSIVHQNSTKIHARKCVVTHDPCKQFFNDNHIQGYGNGTIKFFNLIYEGEIVASMTASKHHRQNASAKVVVLNRLCFADGVNVQGGSSKLFKYFKQWARDEQFSSILSWSDSCWTEGEIYQVLDFDLVQEYGPDYFYWDMKSARYVSKQSQKKSNTGCPMNITERDWCVNNGLFRIWNCGKKKWEYDLSERTDCSR